MANYDNYPDDWSQRREAVLKRDNYRCQMCNAHISESALDIDHIVPLSDDGGNNIDNLQTLCVSCHYVEKHNSSPPKHALKREIKKINPETVNNVQDVKNYMNEKFDGSFSYYMGHKNLKPFIEYVFGWNDTEYNPSGYDFTASNVTKEEVQNKYLMSGKSMTAEELANEFNISIDDAKLATKIDW